MAGKNRAQRGRSRHSTPTIGIFIETATSWGRRVVEGILDYAQRHGPWHIFIEPHGPEEPLQVPDGWRGDGIIARVATRAAADKLEATGAPIVNISSIRVKDADYPRVMTTPAGCARLATETFWARGFQNFGYVGNPSKGYVQAHFHAFEESLATRSHKCAFFQPDGNAAGMIRWLHSLPKPAAVFCWGPSIGREVIDACLSAGIGVPHDIAVLGSDYDDLLSAASYPPQSGIRIASEQIGRTAAAILDGLMHGRKPVQNLWNIEPQGVMERLSTDTLAVSDRRLASVMRHIFEHAHEPITVEDVLHKNPMARRSLERKFRQFFGCSIIEQIRQIRINKARLLLAGTDEPISLIAEKCGFKSYNYLGRVFQEETGMTPRGYRAKTRARSI